MTWTEADLRRVQARHRVAETPQEEEKTVARNRRFVVRSASGPRVNRNEVRSMGMFDFLLGVGNYEERCVGRHDAEFGFVSTAYVPDGQQPYETAVQHTDYRDDGMVIVEAYSSREDAARGHARWVAAMTSEPLPESLTDCANAEICGVGEALDADMRPTYQRRSEAVRG